MSSKNPKIPSLASKPDMWTDEEDETSPQQKDRALDLFKQGMTLDGDTGTIEVRGDITASLLNERDPFIDAVESVTDRCFTEAANLGWHKSYDKLLRDIQNANALNESYGRTEEDYLNWISSKMLLVTGEINEAQDELRNGRDVKEIYYKDVEGLFGTVGADYPHQRFGKPDDVWSYTIAGPREGDVPLLKPEGWLVEMADAFIRIGDLVGTVAGQEGVMFGPIVAGKLQFNTTRGVMHGGKKF